MRLKGRFSLSHAAVAAVTLAACLALSQRAARWLYQREETRRQAQMLADFSQSAREAVFKHEDLGLIQAMRTLLKDPSLVYAAFYNPASRSRLTLPAGMGPEAWRGAGAASPQRAQRRSLSAGTAVEVWSLPLQASARGSAWVELAFSSAVGERLLDQQMREWDRLLLWILLAGLALAAVLGWFMARRLVRPLLAIGEGTRLVRSGKLDHLIEAGRGDEIGDLARDFNSMVLQLKELDEMKRDFVAGVTHDFGSPLHAIQTTIVHLLAGKAGPLGERHAEYLLMISNNLSSLTAFVNNLLTVSRIEAAKVEPYFEPVDVMGHVEDLMKLYEAQAKQKDLGWKMLKKSAFLSLEADVTMFRQIVMNLLSNALKFTDHGGIEVGLMEEGEDFILEVRDSGLGIDPSHHAQIFDKFYRVHQDENSPQRQGSGLGLAIVKGLAEAHGGSISVHSALGQGSCFTVRLPKQARTKRAARPGAASAEAP
jgi:signal transduction histidine kinase